jgi:hypothetical protein
MKIILTTLVISLLNFCYFRYPYADEYIRDEVI